MRHNEKNIEMECGGENNGIEDDRRMVKNGEIGYR